MKGFPVRHPVSPRSQSRLFAAVLISLALMLNAGCGSASTSDDATGNTGTAASTGSFVSTSIESGQNPFEVAGIENPQAFLDTFHAVKAAIAKNDTAEVANHILYPLRVNDADGKSTLIKTRRDFIDKYESIMTKAVKDAIASQTDESLFVNYQGVMVGNGEIWFGGSADKPQVIGMIAINHITGRR